MRLAVFALFVTSMAAAAPAEDLASPVQAKRDAAAKLVRASYAPAPRSKWEPVVAKLVAGMPQDKVAQTLAPYHVTTEMGAGGARTETIGYRLDDDWVVAVTYHFKTKARTNKTVAQTDLHTELKRIWVEPPKGFTGAWTIYFANGQKSHEIHFKDGKYFGDFTVFHDDGSKAVVQHYGPSGIDGEDVGYFKSGKIMYRGQYKAGVKTGTWTYYDESGAVQRTEKL